jgi:hypothetical protein
MFCLCQKEKKFYNIGYDGDERIVKITIFWFYDGWIYPTFRKQTLHNKQIRALNFKFTVVISTK